MPNYDFPDDGFCVLRGLCDPAPIERALSNLEVMAWSGRAVNFAGDGQVNSVHILHETRFFQVLGEDVVFHALAKQLLGEQGRLRGVELFAKPAHVGLPSPWHQDNAYWCLDPAIGLTIWIALDHCDDENGGLTYLQGSHRGGLRPHVPSFAPGSSQRVEVLPPGLQVTPILEPGDALVHHCLTIHGSAPNTSGRTRRGVTLQYQGLSAQVDRAKLAAYESSLLEQVRGRA